MTNSYSRAPIVEAMIDIRVAPQPEIPLLDLADGLRQLSEDSPQRESLFAGRMFFSSEEEMSPFGFDEGIRYTSKDGQKTFQTRTDGFTVSVLLPYTEWPDLRNEAHKLWTGYTQARQPQEITRVAVATSMNPQSLVENAEILYRATRPTEISFKGGRVVVSSKAFHDSSQEASVDRAPRHTIKALLAFALLCPMNSIKIFTLKFICELS